MRGDIYTHTMHGHAESIVDPQSKSVWSDVMDAKSRGVHFDVGHGQSSFSWTVAEICAAQGFWPDMLGTDLHIGNKDGPAYDLPTVMSKFLHLGIHFSFMSITSVNMLKSLQLSYLRQIFCITETFVSKCSTISFRTVDTCYIDSIFFQRCCH